MAIMIDILKPMFKIIWSQTKKSDDKRIARQAEPVGIKTVCDIAYVKDGNKYHTLDFYYPENTKEPLPLIIDIHGGGWWYGTKEINKYYCMDLAKRGFVVTNINYRLVDDVRFIDQLKDVSLALKWIGENAQNYFADMNNVFITGDSAGGQLCCLSVQANVDENLRKMLNLSENSLNFKAVGATCAAVDLLSPNIIMNANLTSLLGTHSHKSSPYYQLMKFENVATSSLPPFFIISASGDFIKAQSIALHKLLNSLGVENRFMFFEEKYNGKKLQHVFNVGYPYIPPSVKANDEMTAFFKTHQD